MQTVECPYSQTAAFCKIRQLLPNCGFFKQPQASLYCTSYCCFTTARFHLNWSLLVSGQNFGLGISFGSHKLIYTARHLTTGNIFASIEASLSVVSGPRLLTSVATSSWPRGDEAKISSHTGRGQEPLKTNRVYQFNNHQYDFITNMTVNRDGLLRSIQHQASLGHFTIFELEFLQASNVFCPREMPRLF